MRYIGIDPGAGGGIAVLCDDRELLPCLYKMPESDGVLLSLLLGAGSARCACEQVWAMPASGRKQGGKSMFSFGEQFGRVKMALVASGIRHVFARPREWQREIGIDPKKGESYTQRKRRIKQAAAELFPGVKITLATADALLIAEYCRRSWEGEKQ